jgi:hypothetical protein
MSVLQIDEGLERELNPICHTRNPALLENLLLQESRTDGVPFLGANPFVQSKVQDESSVGANTNDAGQRNLDLVRKLDFSAPP